MPRYFSLSTLAVFSATVMLQTGCETKTQTGALTGGVLGTAIGAAAGRSVAGAAIGAGVGTIAGGLVGYGMDQSDRKQQQQQQQLAMPPQPMVLVDYATIKEWVEKRDTNKLSNLGNLQIQQADLNKLKQAYSDGRFPGQEQQLTPIQKAYLYGVICYFQADDSICLTEPEVTDPVNP